MNLNKLSYSFDEQADKWVETGCPLMVLCVVLFLLIPSFILKTVGCSTDGYNGNTLQIALSIIPSQLVLIAPILFAVSFSSTHLSIFQKLGLLKWSYSYITEAIIWELILVIPLIIIAALIYFICLRLGYDFNSPVVELLSKSSRYGMGMIFTFAVLIAPVIEEIAFRRALFVFMAKMIGTFSSTILTSLIFALMHGGVVQILPLFILGIVLQRLYLKHGTLFPSILLHACHNLTITVLYTVLKL